MAKISEAIQLVDGLKSKRTEIAKKIREWNKEFPGLGLRLFYQHAINYCSGQYPMKPTRENLLEEAIRLADGYRFAVDNSDTLCPKVCGADDGWWENVVWQREDAKLFFLAYIHTKG